MATVFEAPERPKAVTTDMYSIAAAITAERLSDRIPASLLVECFDPDGVEFANNLRTHSIDSVDADDIPILDDMDIEIRGLLAKSQAEWVRKHTIKPQLLVGDQVVMTHPLKQSPQKGIIKSVNQDNATSQHHPATYNVSFEGDGALQEWILPYETVEASAGTAGS